MFCHANEIFKFHSVVAMAYRKRVFLGCQQKSENNQRKWKGEVVSERNSDKV
jgi:hypothetical protein